MCGRQGEYRRISSRNEIVTIIRSILALYRGSGLPNRRLRVVVQHFTERVLYPVLQDLTYDQCGAILHQTQKRCAHQRIHSIVLATDSSAAQL